MKPLVFLGRTRDDLRAFPEDARRGMGFQLDRVQRGLDPDDWKPTTSIGTGVREIRYRDETGAFRRHLCREVRGGDLRAACVREKNAKNVAARSSPRAAASEHARRAPPMSESQTFSSVWDALEDTPEAAANMRLRSELMIALQDAIDHWRETSTATSVRLGIDAARLDDLQRGRISNFSLDDLVGLAERGT